MNEKQETIETYNRSAVGMSKNFDALGARIFDIDLAFSYISKKNPSVLEIGCGNGRDAKEILKRTPNYLGFDLSERMIELAKKYVTEGKFVVADFETFNFPEGTDIIFSFASLLHSDEVNLVSVFKKAHGSLNKEGVFFISLQEGSGKEVREDEFGKRTYYLYTPQEIERLVSDKFKMLETDTQNLNGRKWFTIILQKK